MKQSEGSNAIVNSQDLVIIYFFLLLSNFWFRLGLAYLVCDTYRYWGLNPEALTGSQTPLPLDYPAAKHQF